MVVNHPMLNHPFRANIDPEVRSVARRCREFDEEDDSVTAAKFELLLPPIKQKL